MHKGFGVCAAVAVAFAVAACGSSGSGSDPFGAEPDYNAVQGHFDHPDGTFNGGNAGSVMGNATGSADANVGGVFSGGGTSTSGSGVQQKALHILGGTTSSQLACSDLQAGNRTGSCTCPSGGSFSYEVDGGGSQSNSDFTMKLRMNACASQDVVVDGTEFLHMVSSQGAGGAQSFNMLFVVTATVSKGGVTHTLDLAEQVDSSGTLRLAVKVDDGWVVVSVKEGASGVTYEVKDKDGTWTCNYQNGAGTCTSDHGGQPVSFKQ
jgi:hypothetical protein